ncbi:DUF4349 domain-containing protein [Phycicoccus endophyticus]|uniref:DUF4349 domain-containing protein n=1 Tax=Phycicoccus endophyticus TaxID=1690220 RepID=A0A7G9R4T3_9MICO|nr:DUF4349 domain-containing protein [Phycicoccus endophyticus]NHI18526.1 DUF4349 domain-containing protein [Phycicoccus endophyticus]QNN50608.1 DUF4349 domain-containing protein [Phycicoccus endophyticus]GGL23081.1 hypothetical protein GCM10012283_01470 [Phycicoccus endophyticus]
MRAAARPSLPRLAAALAAGLALTLLGGCSSGGDGDAGSSADIAADAPGEDRAGAAQGEVATGEADTVQVTAASVADRRLARRADVELEVEDVAAAAARLRTLAARAGGLVVSEQVSGTGATAPEDPDAPGWGTVTISVPAESLDSTLEDVARLGRLLSRSTTSEDVTAQYVDTTARLQTMRASVQRVRTLLGRAEKIADVVSIEAELSRRQADLESLERQLASLEDQVALSPVTVGLSTADAQEEDPSGFLAGLASGWSALTTSVQVLLTLLGALLPFALVAALVLVPLVTWLRRRTRSGALEGPSAPPPAAPTS